MHAGAFSRMCDLKLITNSKVQKFFTPIHLPDGSSQVFKHIANVTLNNKTTLCETLQLPTFQYNLLSVNKLSKTSYSKFISILHIVFDMAFRLKKH